MRFVASFLLCGLSLLAGCAVNTESSFQMEESAPLDMGRVHAELNALFSYCAGVKEEHPDLPPPDTQDTQLERIYALADALHAQAKEVQSELARGCFGENNRGYLELRKCESLQDPELKNEAQKALAAVNKDRKTLYYELAVYHHHSGLPVSTIEELAADTYAAHAKSGQWLQVPPAGSRFEHFMKTALGTSLGNKAVAAAWIVVP